MKAYQYQFGNKFVCQCGWCMPLLRADSHLDYEYFNQTRAESNMLVLQFITPSSCIPTTESMNVMTKKVVAWSLLAPRSRSLALWPTLAQSLISRSARVASRLPCREISTMRWTLNGQMQVPRRRINSRLAPSRKDPM